MRNIRRSQKKKKNTPSSPVSPKTNELLQQALGFHQKGDHQQAELTYRQILLADPDHPDANHLLGILAFQGGDNKHAITLITKAIQKKPNQASYHSNLGLAFHALGQFDDAIKAYKKALRINPDSAEASYNMGISFQKQGNLHEAVKAYKLAIHINPAYGDACFNLGNTFLELNEHHSATDTFQTCVKLQPNNTKAYNNLGVALQRQNQREEAVAAFQKAVYMDPNFIEAQYNLGNVFLDLNRTEKAAAIFTKIIELAPDHAEAFNCLGKIYLSQGNHDKAISSFQKAISCRTDFLEAYNNWGNELYQSGRLDEATKLFQTALTQHPNHPVLLNNFGDVLLAQKKLGKAVELFNEAVLINPNSAQSFNNLGVTLNKQGNHEEASAAFQKAIDLKPDYAEAHNNLGNTLKDLGKFDKAYDAFQLAIRHNPKFAEAYYNLGILFLHTGRFTEAIAAFQKALTIKPDYLEAHNNMGNAYLRSCRFDEACASYRKALAIDPSYIEAHSCLIFALHYLHGNDGPTLFEEHRAWGQKHGSLNFASFTDKRKHHLDKKLRVGYVSPDFRTHSVGFFIEPILTAHDKSQFEIFCYSNTDKPDTTTDRLRNFADKWVDIHGEPDKIVSDRILADRIDILVDLAGHTDGNRLMVFDRKPAPVQVTYLGYPNTTGLPNMDYRITDNWADPEGFTEKFHTEKLVRLPHGFLCYAPPKNTPAINPLPALTTGFITFGSFNNLAKITTDIVKTWATILKAVPGSEISLKAGGLNDENTKKYIASLFEKNYVDAGRILFTGHLPSLSEHFASYHTIDIALDTFPYNGTATTCEALWMGVPVISLAGQTHVSRVGVSLLSNLGLHDLIAQSEDQYVEKAVKLAGDLQELQKLRAGLRERMIGSNLTNAKLFIRSLEDAYRNMWIKQYEKMNKLKQRG